MTPDESTVINSLDSQKHCRVHSECNKQKLHNFAITFSQGCWALHQVINYDWSHGELILVLPNTHVKYQIDSNAVSEARRPEAENNVPYTHTFYLSPGTSHCIWYVLTRNSTQAYILVQEACTGNCREFVLRGLVRT